MTFGMSFQRILSAASIVLYFFCSISRATEPSPSNQPGGVVWAEQGWTQSERDFYHFASQGSILSPTDWFMALERASSRGLLSDPAYLSTLGFLAAPPSPSNSLGLPIGFAVAPDNSMAKGTIGFTCSACHSGQLQYKGYKYRIDGAQTLANTPALGGELQKAMLETYYSPEKWNRFAHRVLKKQYNVNSEKQLRTSFGDSIRNVEWGLYYAETLGINPVVSGYGRSDAIDTGANKLFAIDLRESSNFHVANAPVSYPFLWDIWKFDWLQYDGSFVQPMGRNVGEALGVGASTNYLFSMSPGESKWANSVNVSNLIQIQTQLHSLKAPVWPSKLFGPYNSKLAMQGRSLFTQNCSSCHAPRPILPPGDRFAKIAVYKMPADEIGTDPQRVINTTTAKFDPSKLFGFNSPDIDLAQGLFSATDGAKNWAYDKMNLTPEQRGQADGFDRPNIFHFEMVYKARTLDGVWTSPPFLHNGSVRNIYELLSPVSQRAKQFWVGLSDFDPVRIGLGPKANNYGFVMDTAIIGNSNSGHEFSNISGKGVIGPLLSHQQKMALIEYLKAIPEMPPTPLPGVSLDWLK
jgi:hypothetical protein